MDAYWFSFAVSEVYVDDLINLDRIEKTVKYFTCDVWDGSVATSFAGGTGTKDDPYLISSGAQLAYLSKISNKVNYGTDLYFELTNSIDLNGNEWTPICYAGGASTSWKYFSGNFDGNGHIIAGLSFNQTSKYGAGLFTSISGTVSNLTLEGEINALHRAGALCYYLNGGNAENINSYTNITTTGTSSGCYTGGIFGSIVNSQVVKCNNYGSIEATSYYVGGITGKSKTSTISNCNNFGMVNTTSNYIGGITGNATTDTVVNCNNYGNVGVFNSELTNKGIAGIVGWQTTSTSVTSCNNYGDISGNTNVGGIAGYLGAGSTVTNCTNDGVIKAKSAYGDLVGYDKN